MGRRADAAHPDGGPSASGVDDRLAAFVHTLVATVDGDAAATAAALGLLAGDEVTHVVVYEHDAPQGALAVRSTFVRDLPSRLAHDRIGLDTMLPVTEAWSRGATIVLPLAALDEYPFGAMWLGAPTGVGSLIAEPLRVRGVAVGVLVVVVAGSTMLTWQFCRRVTALADSLALWLVAGRADPVEQLLAGSRSSATGPDAAADAAARTLRLTRRQRQVLALVQAGRTNAQIARHLDFALGTVKADLTALYRVFGAADRTDLVRRALAAGVVLDLTP